AFCRERGVLFALTQAPIAAVLGGVFFRIVDYPVAILAVLLSSVLLPAWIAYRKSRSTDPAQPVHHPPPYLLFATVPCAVFSVVRIPAYAWLKIPYWHPWYEFGARLTGAPDSQYASLGPGALLYTLQGCSLGLGYYVLFKRHSLLNAVLFLGGFLSSNYSFVF